MQIQNRISLIILGIFLGGWLVAGLSTVSLELHDSQTESVRMARVLLNTASAVRSYTTDLIEPLDINDNNGQVFIAETVPSYAAQQVFLRLGEQYQNFRYKETALNPTNPKDTPMDWQVAVIQYFIDHADATELVNTRLNLNQEESLYVSQPIRITSQSCLECHSTPDVAPPSQVATYGNRGFGWKLDEVIGARFIEVPTSIPTMKARRSIVSYLLLIASILLLAYLAVLLVVKTWVTQPLDQLAKILEEVTKKPLGSHAQLPETRIDSVGQVINSVNRLISSLNYTSSRRQDLDNR